MNRKKLLSLGLAFLFAVALTACGQEQPQPTNPPETEVTTTAPQETAPILPNADLAPLEALLGLTDTEAAEHLGGGEENWTEDKSFFIGRIYQTTLLDQPVTVYTSYNDQNTVASVSAWITDGTREVTEEEVGTWVQQISGYVGSDPIFDDTTSEAGSQNWKWEKDNVFISLRWLGDIVTLDLVPAVGELK